MRLKSMLSIAAFAMVANAVSAQLPPDAVMLDKVKITEVIQSKDLDPVTLKPADPNLPTWEHEGVVYGSSAADSKDKFMADPAKYAAKAKEERYVQNFTKAMSIIWCPVTDEVNPGGLHQWNVEGVTWEACCEFCETSYREEDFERASELLLERAKKSFDLTDGKYSTGHSSPVEGAIKKPGSGSESPAGHDHHAPAAEPEYMAGRELKATWADGIALVFENRCMTCHRPGGTAPMSFTTLNDVKKWTKSLKNSVVSRGMPPWPADPAVGSFANSNALTQKEIDLIAAWADAGYPPGDTEYKIQKPLDAAWSIGEPDHVFELPEQTIGENEIDVVKEIAVETNFPEDKWIAASQIVWGNDFDTFSVDGGPLGMFATGNTVTDYHNATGQLLKKGEKVTVRVRYMKEAGYESTDPGIKIAVKFAEAPLKADVQLDQMANTDFTIPPGAEKVEVKSAFTFPADGQVVSVMPMMKFRGKSASVKAVLPDGTEKQLLSIPNWDPNWKFRYELAEPLAAPKGTVVELTAVFDNSKTNIRNPDASAEVTAAPGGEVAEGWLGFTLN